jgi:DNA-binding GntR family transcriptional regulator
VADHEGEGIDQASPVPFYEQLTAILRREIAAGRLPPGKIEGGEDRLAQLYGVSRPTVRRALDALKAEGLVTTSRSKGTYVLRPEDRPRSGS